MGREVQVQQLVISFSGPKHMREPLLNPKHFHGLSIYWTLNGLQNVSVAFTYPAREISVQP